jgi:serine/threonine protein kinase
VPNNGHRYAWVRDTGVLAGDCGLLSVVKDIRSGELFTAQCFDLESLRRLDPENIARLRREIAEHQRLRHPNICRVIEIFFPSDISASKAVVITELLDNSHEDGKARWMSLLEYADQSTSHLPVAEGEKLPVWEYKFGAGLRRWYGKLKVSDGSPVIVSGVSEGIARSICRQLASAIAYLHKEVRNAASKVLLSVL